MSQSQIAYQLDRAGFYAGITQADPSPAEPGVYLLPAGAISTAPPSDVPPGKWPRWNGSTWELVNKPRTAQQQSAVDKLSAFLAANPDVKALIEDPQP